MVRLVPRALSDHAHAGGIVFDATDNDLDPGHENSGAFILPDAAVGNNA